MALLQVVDSTDTTHNYKNTKILGHDGRTSDSDVDSWYEKSIFTEDTASSDTSGSETSGTETSGTEAASETTTL